MQAESCPPWVGIESFSMQSSNKKYVKEKKKE
jgi:hypothetical protein